MNFAPNLGVPEHALDAVLRALSVELPLDYKEFLRVSNGGEGFLGRNYVRLWKAEELKPMNAGYGVAQFAPGLLLFGTDGGGEAFAFDTQAHPWTVVRVPFIGMGDPQCAMPLGRSFREFLENIAR
jgi:hypothetical protein